MEVFWQLDNAMSLNKTQALKAGKDKDAERMTEYIHKASQELLMLPASIPSAYQGTIRKNKRQAKIKLTNDSPVLDFSC
jgi:hypothetical protein